MGKPQVQQQPGISEPVTGGGGGGGLRRHCAEGISWAGTLRCVFALLFGACVLLSAIFWLPPFRSSRSAPDNAASLTAEIQASFILQKPLPVLAAHVERLEYDIFVEVGVPNTQVSIISMHPWGSANSTCVVFGVLPNSNNAPISSPALSVLRSSLIELVLQQLNLSLTPSIFGRPYLFEVLRFPGGITVIPVQSASIWERTQSLFNFKLNNSIIQIQRNLDQLKDQLKIGLNLRSYENVYVKLTNENGSTVAPSVTVQASVLSDFGSGSLLPDRLKQLAQVITGSHAKNLGLNHSVFGKVKQVELSSYLQDSISSLEPPSLSPSPAPSPSHELPHSAVPPLAPTSSPHSPAPSTGRYCRTFQPSGSPLSHGPVSNNGPQPPSQTLNSPGPSPTVGAPSKQEPHLSILHPPNASPTNHRYPSLSHTSPNSAPTGEPLGPTSQMAPEFSPLSPAASYSSSPPQDKGNDKAPMPPISISSPISPSPPSQAPYLHAFIWLTGLFGLLIYHLLCGTY